MGVYANRIRPRLVNAACGAAQAHPHRERTCAGLRGRVLEIGFGSGLNVPFYPAAVTEVVAIEPSDAAWRLASGRLAASAVPVERAGLDGQSLPVPADSCDTALTTWTLCAIPDPAAAVREIRRVLKPGGTLHFAEHGLAPDAGVRRWQRRLNPLQRAVFGCRLTNPVSDLLTAAGFAIRVLDVFYEAGAPRPFGAQSVGVAVAP
ncbi:MULTISPECIES: class I SAM-dependent methyltransferase [Amycolatopsis]|uniref:Class I SAM-dependent methyltransferase n=1 Tax=Amycolatopsis tucumanensis TaxID=401106 RepID=A0ABP7JEY6_9PSEU|nr:class I SAM-dependent methyltransferase [Amycolatopsis tucumanensis]MCF6427269.1 class I SAM-dependent methyltransferase [Amycolatopsis tucumanensis]